MSGRIASDSGCRISRASRSLAMAGRALDPNAAGGSDLALAELLLKYTLASAAAVFGGDDDARSTSDAVAALERSGSLARAAGSAQQGRSVLACLTNDGSEVCGRDDLVEAEFLLDKLLRVIRGEPAISRAARWSRWGFALLVAGGVTGAMTPTLTRLLHGGPWQRYKWTTSSGVPSLGFGTSGLLGAHGVRELVFHTATENRPWVSIDLLETRSVHVIEITNREDCCQDRAVPLVIEMAGDDKHFVEVARKKEVFTVWKAEFPTRRARYVRMWVDAQTAFHLQEIVIR